MRNDTRSDFEAHCYVAENALMRDKARKALSEPTWAAKGEKARFVQLFILSLCLMLVVAYVSNSLPDTLSLSTVMLTGSAICVIVLMCWSGIELIRLG